MWFGHHTAEKLTGVAILELLGNTGLLWSMDREQAIHTQWGGHVVFGGSGCSEDFRAGRLLQVEGITEAQLSLWIFLMPGDVPGCHECMFMI